jgi:signal transduction histidine kinase
MNLYGLSNILITVSSLSMGLFVYIKGYKHHFVKLWPIFAVSVATYGFGAYMVTLAADARQAIFWWKVSYIGIITIPFVFLYFIYEFLRINRPLIIKIYAFISVLFLIINFFFEPLFLAKATLFFTNYGFVKPVYFIYPGGPLLYIFIILYFFGTIAYTHFLLVKRYKQSSGVDRNQLRYFFVATGVGFAGGGLSFLPCFNINLYPFFNFTIILAPVLLTYAIFRYRLMDITVAVTRAGLFSLVYLIVLGLPVAIGYRILGSGNWIIPLFFMAIFASVGPFIYIYLERKAEQGLRKEEFRAHQQLNNLAQNMMRFTDLELLLKLIVHELVKIMKVTSAYIYLKEQGNTHYSLKNKWSVDGSIDKQTEFSEDSALVKDILLRRTPIILEELKFDQAKHSLSHIKAIRDQLQKVKASVVIPAFKGDYLFGLLILGPRRNNRIFTQEDLNLLMLLASQAVLAIENAQLFEREKLYLAEKSRRDALADMAPGVSHQFNNRFIAINSEMQACLDLLGQKPLEGLSKEEILSLFKNFKEFGKLIIEDTVKGREIAQAIMKKGKADLSFTETYLTPVIENSIRLLKLSRTRASLEGSTEPEIAINIEKDLPKIVLSVSLMEDVFYNLVDNARDAITIKNRYIKEGKLNFKDPFSGKIIISAARQDKAIIIKIQDNGIGIEKEKIKRLFSPFFTSKATAHKGTGMGLYVIQGMIEQHKGKISVESEYEKGTTFTIELPTGQGMH